MAFINFQPKDNFKTLLYTGNGSDGHSITGVGFKPDFVWTKNRGSATDNYVHDIVRGVEKAIRPNVTTGNYDTSINLQSFDSDGFTVGTQDGLNKSGKDIVCWNWLLGGSQGSSNTDGTINTTYTSANTTSGVSVSTWTGSGSNGTIGHGLGKVPKMLIIKRTDGTQAWMVYHVGAGNNSEGQITTGAFSGSSSAWQDTDPTTSVFYVSGSTGDSVNASGYAYVGYAFAEVKGFSKIGKYVGNGSADGPFIYTGFKPSFVIIKNISATESWYILDTKRPGYNNNNYYITANSSNSEGTSTSLATSLVSNGFKIDNSDTSMNTNGQNYIYMAFAEEPLVSSNNIPATAR